MPVRFIIGRAGTGKTQHVVNSIVTLLRDEPVGAPIYWIVPRQVSLLAERQIAARCRAFTRARVVSFDRFASDVLTDTGGVGMPEVTRLGRQMLLAMLLRKHRDRLKFFSASSHRTGLAAQLDAAFSELEQAGRSPLELLDILPKIEKENPDPSFSEKFADFVMLYEAYLAYIGQERLDPHRRNQRVLAHIRASKLVQSATIFIDFFTDFTEMQRQMLAHAAAVAQHVDIALQLDPASPVLKSPGQLPDDLNVFHRSACGYRLLRKALDNLGVAVEAPVILDRPERFQSASLSHLEQQLFEPNHSVTLPSIEGSAIEFVEAASERAEVDAVATRIRELVASGTRFRDIVVLARSLEGLHEIIDASFQEHGIPRFIDRRRVASHHPLLQCLRALLHIPLYNWPREHAIALIKSGLVSLSDKMSEDEQLDLADAMENYVIEHRIEHGTWELPWDFHRIDADEDDPDETRDAAPHLDRIEAARRHVVAPVIEFRKALSSDGLTVADCAAALYRVIEKLRIRENLHHWMQRAFERQQLEQYAEHLQVWNNVVSLLDQLVDLIGSEPVRAADFVDILESGLERFDLAITPPTVDQVLVGSIDRTLPINPQIVFILGMNEGAFPCATIEDPLIPDDQRRMLEAQDLNIAPSSRQSSLYERQLAYFAFTRASHKLVLSRAVASERREVDPSPFWLEVKSKFSDAEQSTQGSEQTEGAPCSPAAVASPRCAVTRMLEWARANDPDARSHPDARLYESLRTHSSDNTPLGSLLRRAWSSLWYSNDARLDPKVAAAAIRSPLHTSVSRLESFTRCPYQHFSRYTLSLSPRAEGEVSPLDLGNLFHSVMENVIGEFLGSSAQFRSLAPEEARRKVRLQLGRIGEDLRGRVLLTDARLRYLMARIERTLQRLIMRQAMAASQSAFLPAKVEVPFGKPDAPLPALKLPLAGDRQALVYGRIDRIDVAEAGESLLVLDYKLRNTKLELKRVYHGLALQLLSYLLVLEEARKQGTPEVGRAVAAFYVRIVPELEKVNHPAALRDRSPAESVLKSSMPEGIYSAEIARKLDTGLQTGASQIFPFKINKDGSLSQRVGMVSGDSLAKLLRLVRTRLQEAAAGILEGRIEVFPYRLGDDSPCARCDYFSVCRFDLSTNRYRKLENVDRKAIIQRIDAVETKA